MFKAFVTVSTPDAVLLCPAFVSGYKVVRDQFRVYADTAHLGDFHGDIGIWVKAKDADSFRRAFVAAVAAASFHGDLRLTAVCSDEASFNALSEIDGLTKTR